MDKDNKQVDVHTDTDEEKPKLTKDQIRERVEKAFRKNAKTKDGRARAYAFMLYDDSMSDNWREVITETHVPTAVSYHDKDTNPDGEIKKPHYHVLMSFDNKKSVDQIVDVVVNLCNDTGGVPAPETVGSLRGYARYLLHLDNPEKYQYDRDALQLFNGFEFDALISREDDDFVMLGEIFNYVDDNDIRYTSELMRKLKVDNFDLFKLACKRTYAVVEYIKSYAYEQRDKTNKNLFDRSNYEKDDAEFYRDLQKFVKGNDENGN